MTTWARLVVDSTHAAFAFQGDPQRAEGAAKYMKHIAPFIGITAPDQAATTQSPLARPTNTIEQRTRAGLREIDVVT